MNPTENRETSGVGGPHYRLAIATDVERLVKLINAAFVVEQVAIEGDRVDRAGVERYLRSGKFLLLEEGGSILGCVYVEKRGERGYVGLLSVDPAQQKRGLGRSLATAAEKYFQEENCGAVDLRVISARARELVPFYQKLGYAVMGTSPLAPEVPLKAPCHYIHMSKALASRRC